MTGQADCNFFWSKEMKKTFVEKPKRKKGFMYPHTD